MGAYEAVKDIAKIAQQIDNPELLQRTLEAQQQTLDLQEEVQALRQRVADLEDQKEIEAQLEYDDGIYWRRPEEGERDGPYCQLCWDDRDKLIRLQDFKRGFFACHACDTSFDHDAATGSRRSGRSRGVVDPGINP